MFRFFLFFALFTSVVMGQQSLVITFTGDGQALVTKGEEFCYNVLSNGTVDFYGSTKTPTTGLVYTDGSESQIGISVAPVSAGGAAITSFEGDTSLFISVFGDSVSHGVNGVLSSAASSSTILTLCGLDKGEYILSVLGARGNVPVNSTTETSYTLDFSHGGFSVEASILSYCGTEPSVNGSTISVLTVGNNKTAENWALMQFRITLEEDIQWLKLCTTGNQASVAAIAFTSVPEPSTTTLSLLVMCGMAVCRRRRK